MLEFTCMFYLPFSKLKLGIGEMLARDQLFLYITSIFQRFDVHFPAGEVPEIKAVPGLAFGPSAFKIVFSSRKR